MQWNERAVILTVARHGEHHALADVITEERGRWRGLVRGGAGRRLAGVLQPGNVVEARWRGRLESHLGTLSVELVRAHAGAVLQDSERLAGLTAACATLAVALPEREGHPAVAAAFRAFLDILCDDAVTAAEWGGALVRLEVGLLSELGYGLDLARCAATGATDDLVYVSPKSGRAVSRTAGWTYRDKLLPLPAFLLGRQVGEARRTDVAAGLRLTGYFLERHVVGPHGKTLPPARERLARRFSGLAPRLGGPDP